MLSPKFRRRLKRTLIVLTVLLILSVRLFAVFILSESFFGETLTSWVDGERNKEIKDPAFFADAKRYGQPVKVNGATDFTDLQFLDTIVSTKQVVGMGEATHGSKDFFEMKARMFQYLVQKHNYKIFGIEADFACQKINDYVLNGKGDAKEALSHNGYYVWQSKEVVDLIEWMRNYNLSKHDSAKVQFWGYDLQQSSSTFRYLSAYLRMAGQPVDTALVMENFDKELKEKKRPLADSAAWRKNLHSLRAFYAANADTLIARSSTRQYNLCLQMLRNLGWRLDRLSFSNRNRSYGYRDSCMMKNIDWIRSSNGGAKAMLWAHNGHIADDQWDGTPPGKWMGKYLKSRYSGGYYAVGFLFDEGSFTAHKPPGGGAAGLMFSFAKSLFGDELWKVDSMYIAPYRKNHLSNALAKRYSGPVFFHNANIPLSSALYKAFNTSQPSYFIGAGFFTPASAVVDQNYAKPFDAVIFMNKIRAAENYLIGTHGADE